jgi:hypothetical protein
MTAIQVLLTQRDETREPLERTLAEIKYRSLVGSGQESVNVGLVEFLAALYLTPTSLCRNTCQHALWELSSEAFRVGHSTTVAPPDVPDRWTSQRRLDSLAGYSTIRPIHAAIISKNMRRWK